MDTWIVMNFCGVGGTATPHRSVFDANGKPSAYLHPAVEPFCNFNPTKINNQIL